MAKKSVREMTKLERMRHSLSSRMFRAVLLGSVLLGIVCLIIGLSLYSVAVARQNISTAFNLSRNAAAILYKAADTESLSREVMNRYHSLSEAERADPSSESYRAHFADLTEREDYKMILSVLREFMESSDVYDIYLAMYDSKTDVMVYIVDPDPKNPLEPGTWESVKHKGIKKFLNWDGTGMLYDIGKPETYGWMCTSGVPVRARSGEVTGFILADITLDNVVSGIWRFVLQYTVGILLVIGLFSFLLLRYIGKTVVRPINDITEASRNYAADKKAGVQKTQHFTNLDIRTGDEIENLSLTVKDMEGDLQDYEKNLTQITAEKQRIHTELTLANRIQADMLPNIFPAFPERDEFDIFASMTPAKEVGGDFYDFFFIDRDHFAMVIADVSGKGIPAAMFMVMAKGIIETQCMSGSSPAQILTKVNKMICAKNREKMFVTVWLGILDLRSGELIASNAGHEYPIVKHPASDFEVLKDKHGFVIGGFERMKYQDYMIRMKPGSKLFVYTDGVAEATNAGEKLFGLERTVSALNQAKDRSPQIILETVDAAVREFVGNAEQFDDLTMMCVEYVEKPADIGKMINQ
jgi:sigma-B regulation protein RsbU (phosphoserine phosphatase)